MSSMARRMFESPTAGFARLEERLDSAYHVAGIHASVSRGPASLNAGYPRAVTGRTDSVCVLASAASARMNPRPLGVGVGLVGGHGLINGLMP